MHATEIKRRVRTEERIITLATKRMRITLDMQSQENDGNINNCYKLELKQDNGSQKLVAQRRERFFEEGQESDETNNMGVQSKEEHCRIKK